jgi:hypothetical protein
VSRPGLIERLRAATGYVSPADRRALEAYRTALAEAHRKWEADGRREAFADPLIAESEAPQSIWRDKLEIPDEQYDDPFEESRAFLDAAERYDEKLAAKEKAYRERAASASDARERRRVEALAAEVEAEREALDAETSKLWGLVFRPVVRGGRDPLSELRCRCRPGCPRLFRSSRERRVALRGWHPTCFQEARERASEPASDPYVAELLERLPPL